MKNHTIKERKAYLHKWEESGKPIKHFCLENGIRESTFHSWKKNLASKPSSFIEVPVKEFHPSNPTPLLLVKGEYKITLSKDFDAPTLKRLLRILEEIHA